MQRCSRAMTGTSSIGCGRRAVKWQTTNVRRVATTGLELGVQRTLGGRRGALLAGQDEWLASDPDGLTLLSSTCSSTPDMR